jgi:hypothetical protein
MMQRIMNPPTASPMMTTVWVGIGIELLLGFAEGGAGEEELLLAEGLGELPVEDAVGLGAVVPVAVEVAWSI